MSMSRRKLFGATALIVGSCCAILFSRWGDDEFAHGVRLDREADNEAEARRPSAAEPVSRRSDHVHGRATISIRVMDANSRQALPGARLIRLMDSGQRVISAWDGMWIGDPRGNIDVVQDDDPEPGSVWQFTCKGYIARVFERLPTEVLLERGHSVRVRLRWYGAGPAAGVPLLAFREQMPAISGDGMPVQSVFPGLDPDSAIHLAVTDVEGVACFDDLAPVAYGIGIDGTDHVLVDLDSDVVVAGGAHSEVQGVVAPVYSCVIGGSGSQVIATRLVTIDAATKLRSDPPSLHTIRRRLEARFPDCKVVVCSTALPAPGLTAWLAVTLDGWRTLEVAHPMFPPSQARQVDVSGRLPAPWGGLRVDLQCPSGRIVDGVEVGVSAIRGNADDLFLGVPLSTGVLMRLPAGRYQVRCWTPFLQLGPEEVEVRNGVNAAAVLRCEQEIQALRLRIRCRGETPNFAVVRLRGDGWQSQDFVTYEPGAVACAGGLGKADLEVRVHGHEVFRKQLTIVAMDDVQEILVDMR